METVPGKTGWGVCGHYLARELNKLPKLPDDITVHPMMVTMDTIRPDAWSRVNIGYCFFETPEVLAETAKAAEKWDHIVFGSQWCEDWARKYGITNCSTIRQGVDFDLFKPAPRKPNKRFVIGSFGKFELRKGQDIVLKALKILSEKYPEIDWELHASWYNPWPESMKPMSKVMPLLTSTDSMSTIKAAVAHFGLPKGRVVLHPQLQHKFTPDLYRECDVAVFPNRAEGGCNLCLMEAMACGVPVIAVDAHSHSEVLSSPNGFDGIEHSDGMQEGWVEPSSYDLADTLVEVWQMLNISKELAVENALPHVRQFTWAAMAKGFWDLAVKYAQVPTES
jgi:glycosyltransferase involved in cell wall biosynthesis